MFNLLPKVEKEAVRREYRVRLAAVMCWFAFATGIVAALLLLPSWLLSSQRERAAEERFAVLAKSVERKEAAGQGDVLLAAKSQLELLSREPPKSRLYEVIIKIASGRPSKISLESMTVRGAAGEKRTTHIAGVAQDRGALVAFSRALEGTALFEKVELPLSNLAKEKDIPFSITVTGVF